MLSNLDRCCHRNSIISVVKAIKYENKSQGQTFMRNLGMVLINLESILYIVRKCLENRSGYFRTGRAAETKVAL